MKKKMAFGVLAGMMIPTSMVRADSMSLLPSQWNMILNVAGSFTANSDGGGYHAFAGGGRESLLQFDLSGIPSGAIITSATLTMYMDRSAAGGMQPFFLHRLTSAWGMGTSGVGQSDAGIVPPGGGGGGGMGYTETDGDATWLDSFYHSSNPTLWTTAGGDYVSAPSAYAMVGSGMATTGVPGAGGPLLSTWTGTGLVSDVQNWLSGANANDGWILNDFTPPSTDFPSGVAFGSETVSRRFIMPADTPSLTNGSDDRPYLTITYSVVPEPGSIALGTVFLLLLRRKR